MNRRCLAKVLFNRQLGRERYPDISGQRLDNISQYLIQHLAGELAASQDNVAFVMAQTTLSNLREAYYACEETEAAMLIHELDEINEAAWTGAFWCSNNRYPLIAWGGHYWGERTPVRNGLTPYHFYLCEGGVFELLMKIMKKFTVDSSTPKWYLEVFENLSNVLSIEMLWPGGGWTNAIKERTFLSHHLMRHFYNVLKCRNTSVEFVENLNMGSMPAIDWTDQLPIDDSTQSLRQFLFVLSLVTNRVGAVNGMGPTQFDPAPELIPFLSHVSKLKHILSACRATVHIDAEERGKCDTEHRPPDEQSTRLRLGLTNNVITTFLFSREAHGSRVIQQLCASGHLGLFLNDFLTVIYDVASSGDIRYRRDHHFVDDQLGTLLRLYMGVRDDPNAWYCLYTPNELSEMLQRFDCSENNAGSHMWQALHRLNNSSTIDFNVSLNHLDSKHTQKDVEDVDIKTVIPKEGAITSILKMCILAANDEETPAQRMAANDGIDPGPMMRPNLATVANEIKAMVCRRKPDREWALSHELLQESDLEDNQDR